DRPPGRGTQRPREGGRRTPAGAGRAQVRRAQGGVAPQPPHHAGRGREGPTPEGAAV
ncbi:MAG: hypothetical protein AVDCRST_MAG02-2244, partial [uncultured Rubrobacteraceae bacterium]